MTSTALRLITFRVGPETFVLDIMAVRQIIQYSGSTSVPTAPAFIEGIVVLRNEVIPIIDLRDPANPRLSPNDWQTDDIESEHDVTEVSPGIIVTSGQPLKLERIPMEMLLLLAERPAGRVPALDHLATSLEAKATLANQPSAPAKTGPSFSKPTP